MSTLCGPFDALPITLATQDNLRVLSQRLSLTGVPSCDNARMVIYRRETQENETSSSYSLEICAYIGWSFTKHTNVVSHLQVQNLLETILWKMYDWSGKQCVMETSQMWQWFSHWINKIVKTTRRFQSYNAFTSKEDQRNLWSTDIKLFSRWCDPSTQVVVCFPQWKPPKKDSPLYHLLQG